MSNILNTAVFFPNFAKNCKKMPDFNITIQNTSNENILKFVANTFLVQGESFEFHNIDESKPSPLAQQLFHLPFVKTIYVTQNFVAIEKFNIVAWEEVQEEVAKSIENYLREGKEVIVQAENTKKVPVSIYAESTPNPSVMKFVANKPLVSGIYEFKDPTAAKEAPIALALFNFPFVKEVFVSENYISIAKNTATEWQDIVMEIRDFLKQYIEAGKVILNDTLLSEGQTQETATAKTNDVIPGNAIEKEIISILDEYVKPAVAGDGGHIAFQSYNENSKTVTVLLQGACSGCPSSTVTLKNGIETMLREMLQGKVAYVEAING